MSTLGQRLREARQHRGMTQRAVAVALGLDPIGGQSAIAKWERGALRPDIGHLRELCRALDISADWMLGLPERETLGGVTDLSGCGDAA